MGYLDALGEQAMRMEQTLLADIQDRLHCTREEAQTHLQAEIERQMKQLHDDTLDSFAYSSAMYHATAGYSGMVKVDNYFTIDLAGPEVVEGSLTTVIDNPTRLLEESKE